MSAGFWMLLGGVYGGNPESSDCTGVKLSEFFVIGIRRTAAGQRTAEVRVDKRSVVNAISAPNHGVVEIFWRISESDARAKVLEVRFRARGTFAVNESAQLPRSGGICRRWRDTDCAPVASCRGVSTSQRRPRFNVKSCRALKSSCR